MIWKTHENLRLVGGWVLPLWKMMEWKSVGMMIIPNWMGKNIQMFQTTNQSWMAISIKLLLGWVKNSIVRRIPHWQYVSPTNIHHIFYPFFSEHCRVWSPIPPPDLCDLWRFSGARIHRGASNCTPTPKPQVISKLFRQTKIKMKPVHHQIEL